MTTSTQRRRVVWVVTGIVVYVTVYLALSRISARMNSRSGIRGFFYVPVHATKMDDVTLERLHAAGSIVFYPLWYVDHNVFGGPSVSAIPLFGLEATSTGQPSRCVVLERGTELIDPVSGRVYGRLDPGVVLYVGTQDDRTHSDSGDVELHKLLVRVPVTLDKGIRVEREPQPARDGAAYPILRLRVLETEPDLGTAADPGDGDLETYHSLVAKRQYHAAYLTFSSIRHTLTNMQEGVEGLEYQRLLTSVAGNGEGEWVAIFKDGSIPLQMKADLLDEIHEQAQRDAP